MSSKFVFAVSVIGAAWAAIAAAQPPPEPAPDKLFVIEDAAPLPIMSGSIHIISSEGAVPGPHVTGKPYSARAITESTQTLADGNRITQRNEAVIYRDTEGRTRREQTIAGVGQWQTEQPVTLINIHDPVADKSYVLDPATKTAREVRRFQMAFAHAGEAIAAPPTAVHVFRNEPGGEPAPAPAGVTVVRGVAQQGTQVFTPAVGAGFAVAPFPEGTTGMYEPAEDLGEQVLEGLLVGGTRMTDTIPAGLIGNERPIEIVTERWYSKDIDALVLQRFSDPRVGETTYRLVNVVLGEPSPDLFQVPQDYEIESPSAPRAGVRVRPGNTFELRVPPPAP